METQEIRHIALPTGEYNAMMRIKCKSLRHRLYKLQTNFPEREWAIAPVAVGKYNYLHIVEIVKVDA
jgi:hypothetical protein